jgi:hypothetical protein
MTFEEKLENYNKQMEQDFAVDLTQTDSIEMARMIREKLTPYAPTFLTTVIRLAACAKSETVRLQASKFGLEALYGKGPINEMEAGIDNLIRNLQAGDGEKGVSPHED